MPTEPTLPGITFLDHTADVGLDVEAETLAELFTRAAAGMACLIRGADLADARESLAERRVTLSADDTPALLRAWLRELLRWHEAEGLVLRAARCDVLTGTRLDAVVTLAHDTLEPIREIKGVTLHGLAVERRGEGWVGRVIFDV